MITYETLVNEANNENIEVYEISFPKGIKGLYCDGYIGINSNLPTYIHKKCVLAEELGHYYTAVGDITDQTKTSNRKIELKGQNWGYEKLIPLEKLINASFSGCTNKHELAEYLDITEEYLVEALRYYENKYGLYAEVEDYCIYFNPLSVAKYSYE